MVALPTLLGAATLVFFIPRLAPGDAVDALAQGLSARSPEQREEIKEGIREDLGLDGPAFRQYVEFLGDLAQGDLGKSLLDREPVASALAERLPRSLELAVLSMVLGLVVGVPIGVLSAVRQNSAVDNAARSFGIFALSLPEFWAAILVVTLGSIWFTWAPPLEYKSLTEDPAQNLALLGPPALILAFKEAGVIVRVVRTQMLEVIAQDYVRTARAKGLSEWTVTLRHAFRNAMLPLITLIGLRVPALLAGVTTLEIVFGIPGVARYALSALDQRDFPALRGSVMVIAVIVIMANLIVDVSYGWIDPRLRRG